MNTMNRSAGGFGQGVAIAVSALLGLLMAVVGLMFALGLLVFGAVAGVVLMGWAALRGRPLGMSRRAGPGPFGPRAGRGMTPRAQPAPWAGDVVDVQPREPASGAPPRD